MAKQHIFETHRSFPNRSIQKLKQLRIIPIGGNSARQALTSFSEMAMKEILKPAK
jgi:hypothetical protein